MQTEPTLVELNPLRTALVVFVPHATINISLLGSSVWAIKLVSSNVSKDRCFQQYLVLEILLTELHTKTKLHFGEKSNVNFAIFLLLFADEICLFPKSLASHNSMQIKDDKVGNSTGYKKERQREKTKDRVRVKTKKLLHYILLVGKYVLVVAKLIFCHSHADWPKTSPKKRNWWTMQFFLLSSGIRQRFNPFVPEWPVTTRSYPCPLYRLRHHQFSRSRTAHLKLHFVEWTLFCF